MNQRWWRWLPTGLLLRWVLLVLVLAGLALLALEIIGGRGAGRTNPEYVPVRMVVTGPRPGSASDELRYVFDFPDLPLTLERTSKQLKGARDRFTLELELELARTPRRVRVTVYDGPSVVLGPKETSFERKGDELRADFNAPHRSRAPGPRRPRRHRGEARTPQTLEAHLPDSPRVGIQITGGPGLRA
ncbi:MAG: hypothetical protein AB1758_18155 [Candidatus Eremiobacterota bacterium]